MLPDRLVIASRNPGKIREIRAIAAGWPVEWVTDAAWPDVEETGETYLENALLKARAVAASTGLPALADDSGLEVDALGGGPGPRSARFAGEGATDPENLDALLAALSDTPPPRTARYRAVAAIAWPDGRTVWAEATCEGSIRSEPRGTGGFGYDPVFEPRGYDVTMAELPPEVKDRLSHRGGALQALRKGLG